MVRLRGQYLPCDDVRMSEYGIELLKNSAVRRYQSVSVPMRNAHEGGAYQRWR